jgi:Uma2 family endonuclease
MYQNQYPRSPTELLPTMYDLPSEDPEESGLPDEFHDFQPKLLRETCQPTTYPSTEIFIGADLNLYYDGRHTQWYKRPDWFLALGVEAADRQEDLRWSYVIWQDFVSPFLVVELLSPGTEDEDLGRKVREIGKPPLKWEVYERILRVPYYVVFDRYDQEFRVFALQGGHYQQLDCGESRFWFEDLGIGLGVWEGAYTGVTGKWLRWYDRDDQWIPTNTEARQVAEQQAQAEVEARQVAEQQAQAEVEARQVAEQQAQAEVEARQVAEQQAQAEAEARRLAIPRLAQIGLTAPQIAAALDLPLPEVAQCLATAD